jgi:uncharacterized protein YjbJ (UPF0337 family)
MLGDSEGGLVAGQSSTSAVTASGETKMNKSTFKGQWHELKGEAKIQWGMLTDDDLEQVEGSAEKLIGFVEERYGYAREQAAREVTAFIRRKPQSPA